MSWLKEAASGNAPPPYTEPSSAPKVKDPAIPNRMVVDKPANRPFLAHREYREKQEALHKAWEERQKEREAKIARGEKVGPPERDPTAQVEVGLLGLMKFLIYMLIFAALAGKFITGSYTWEYESKWTQLKTYWPTNQRLFSERLLAQFDGKVEGRPIYLAIDSDVYDVSSGKAYQPGGSYHILAGVDAARAFGTGCFKTHRTHDTRGMLESELRSLAHWKKFYRDHKDYVKIGRVSHSPIDPASPIPEHCDPKKAEAAAKAAKEKAETAQKEAKKSAHEEL
ncbi:cytochrome b5-like heme/steroid binding domain-containing protein [Collybia nuda]|uniref:Cytochrome b5-like heme/steroid binding domain-containing protein n=1 Tax=Collybia nuda TaxID=64659 RepID=A0A9P5YHQ8_9AGAR|nr:cytochrome b5-like heme/steroid binding domain-containing protein [Collybia nuda]